MVKPRFLGKTISPIIPLKYTTNVQLQIDYNMLQYLIARPLRIVLHVLQIEVYIAHNINR